MLIDDASSGLVLVAALARDLEAAGLLSEASRKTIHNLLAERRGAAGSGGDASTPEQRTALELLAAIAPAADG